MRIDLKKYLFLGLNNKRSLFFKEAQERGIIDFIDPNPVKNREVPVELQSITQAIKTLQGLPVVEQDEIRDYSQANKIAAKINECKHQYERLLEDERVLKLEISRTEIFGDFSLDDIDYIQREGRRVIQFFCAKKGFSETDMVPECALYVGSDHGLDYFMTVAEKPSQFEKMIEMKVDAPVGLLKERLAHTSHQIQGVHEKLKEYAKYNTFLHHALIDGMNHHHLTHAKESVRFEIDDSIFAVFGWVPENKVSELVSLAANNGIHIEEVAIEESDRVPTCLENEGAARIGEDLVHIYDTPATTDKDPSLWVLVFFSLFFAFIVGDGGYGLIFLAAALYIQYKYKNAKGGAKRFANLFTILAVSCLAWGFLTTSFFGITFAPDSPMQNVSLVKWLAEKKTEYHKSQNDETFKMWAKQFPAIQNIDTAKEILSAAHTERDGVKSYDMYNAFTGSILLELALLIGMIHVCLSFMRYLRTNWAGYGWIIFIIGGYLYFPFYLGASSMYSSRPNSSCALQISLNKTQASRPTAIA
jgi:V/A-type H+-transporting ATPase subunit I